MHGAVVRKTDWIGTSIDQESCLFVYSLVVGLWPNVFICLHKGAPCISVGVKETNNLTEQRMHAQLLFFLILLCQTSDKGIYMSALKVKLATECLLGVFQTFVAYLSIS